MIRMIGFADRSIFVERDEDVEFRTPSEWQYIQVKDLAGSLVPSDIDTNLDQFDKIRKEHAAGKRPGTPLMIIVSSSDLGPKLEKSIKDPSWPKDVQFATPSHRCVKLGFDIFPSWDKAFADCSSKLKSVPLSKVDSDTLTWKLAAYAQAIATGSGSKTSHEITNAELLELLDLLEELADLLPDPPDKYIPQSDEPTLVCPEGVRVIEGLSGAGKTSWASEASKHTDATVVYMRARELGRRDFSSWVATHIANNVFKGTPEKLGAAFRPDATGPESLRLVAKSLYKESPGAVVIVDDAQFIEAAQIHTAVKATPSLNWVFLGQPSESLQQAGASIGVEVLELKGWPEDTIARVLHERGVVASAESVSELRHMTSGAPMWVDNVAVLVSQHYGDSLDAYVKEYQKLEHAQSASFEHIVKESVVKTLSPEARRLLGAVAFFKAPVGHETLIKLGTAGLSQSTGQAGRAVRELTGWRVLRSVGGLKVMLHDAYRSVAAELGDELGDDERKAVMACIKSRAEHELRTEGASYDTMLDYLRILAEVGDNETLVNIASSLGESWREHGILQDVQTLLTDVYEEDGLTELERFDVADSLAYFAAELGDKGGVTKWQHRMHTHAEKSGVRSPDMERRFVIRQIQLAQLEEDFDAAIAAFENAGRWLEKDTEAWRVLYYSVALVAFELNQHEKVLEITEAVTNSYMKFFFKFNYDDIVDATAKEIRDKVPVEDPTVEFRHYADCCYLRARSLEVLNQAVELEYFHAHKFYELSDSPISVLKVAKDVIDQLNWEQRDPARSVELIEKSLFPLLEDRRMAGSKMDLRSMYAVSLALNGNHQRALDELKALEPYVGGLNEHNAQIHERRVAIVHNAIDGAFVASHRLGICTDDQ
ncbi:MAG: hypothetical protein KDB68_05040 [Planctomycetes bacterium]|nr:hypothetical protein [Planctomycetota bacterium]